MASEDVLEMAENWVRVFEHRGSYPGDGYDGRDMVLALAAEIERLRRDKARLDALETIIAIRKIVGGPWEGCLPSTRSVSAHSLRDLADAAMGGEEDE